MTENIHASCVAIDGRAVLIVGDSGAGKSDLALRLIDRGAVLVSDDQVLLTVEGERLVASAPDTIAGKIEVRGIGIVPILAQSPMPVALLIELATPERMPEPRSRRLCGIDVPVASLDAFEASAPIKAELAFRRWGLAL